MDSVRRVSSHTQPGCLQTRPPEEVAGSRVPSPGEAHGVNREIEVLDPSLKEKKTGNKKVTAFN